VSFHYRPSSWANCSVHMPAALLPQGTRINTNGAGDAYTSGLLVAAMLRNTGNTPAGQVKRVEEPSPHLQDSAEKTNESRSSASPTKKMTPYTLYMKENYVTLKQQCRGDKKAIFTMCHEMWENESNDVKAMYGRMVKEEYDDSAAETATAIMSDTSMDALESKLSRDYAGVQFHTEQSANASLTLESAVQLAGLIAARHVDMSTRDLDHLDLTELLEKSIMALSPVSTTEI
jgi:HMG (high mobility group) box